MDKRRVKQFVKNITKMFVLKKETIANVVCIDYNHLLGSPVFALPLIMADILVKNIIRLLNMFVLWNINMFLRKTI